jgi:integrase
MSEIFEIGRAIDLWEGALARSGHKKSTRETYCRELNLLAHSTAKRYVHELTLVDYEMHVDRYRDSSPATLALKISELKGFSRFCFDRGLADRHVAEPLKRPRRPRPEDIDVVSVGADEVAIMLEACRDVQELVCIATLAYVGPRRKAASRARRRHVDLVEGTIRFFEKGGQVVVKPLPNDYLALLRALDEEGTWAGPDDYLVPNRRPASVRGRERSDKVIWETVRRVASRAGVRCHVHALRAAFAVQFDEQHPDRLIDLKELMGHARLETTLVYLRRKNKARAMETVRDLSWGPVHRSTFQSEPQEAHTGFEPVLPPWEGGVLGH